MIHLLTEPQEYSMYRYVWKSPGDTFLVYDISLLSIVGLLTNMVSIWEAKEQVLP